MVHATCHPEGATLMYQTMFKRKEMLLTQVQRCGQMSLFDETVENEIIDTEVIEEGLRTAVFQRDGEIGDHELLADYVVKNGVTCSLGELRGILRSMEEAGEIIITRYPAYTESGLPSRFMESKRDRRLTIRRA